MRIAIDLDTGEVRTWAGQVITAAMAAKRRDRFPVEVRYLQNGIVVERPSGAAGVLALKPVGAYAGSFLSAATWTASGYGTSRTYNFDLNLNTEPIEERFLDDVTSITLDAEISTSSDNDVRTSATFKMLIRNDLIRGDETPPEAAPDLKATQAQAVAGEDNATWMTPLRTAQAIEAQVPPQAIDEDAPTDGKKYARKDGAWVEDASGNQVVSSGALSNLTSGQQAAINEGTIVTTTDGRRWVYSGTGNKTQEASYIELGDVSPAWNSVTDKPEEFPPSEHTHDYLEDAPSDDKQYARLNGEWAEVVGGGNGSTNYQLVAEDFTAESGKNYAVDAHPVPAVYPSFTYGGLVFTAKSPTSTATVTWDNDGDLYREGQNSFRIAGGETLSDIIDFINGDDFSFEVDLNEGAELADEFPDDGYQEFTFSGGSAATFSAVEATLPANPATGDIVGFADARATWGSYPLIVLRNEKKIEGGTANFTNNAAGTFFSMVFIDNTTGWRVLSSGTKPLNLTAPTVTGTYAFTASNGTWTGSPTSFSYQWQMSEDGETGWADIEDATASSYLALEADEEKFVRVGVIATNSNGPSTIVYSAASAAIEVPEIPAGVVAEYLFESGAELTDTAGSYDLTDNNSVTFSDGKAIFSGSNWLTSSLSNSGWSQWTIEARVIVLVASPYTNFVAFYCNLPGNRALYYGQNGLGITDYSQEDPNGQSEPVGEYHVVIRANSATNLESFVNGTSNGSYNGASQVGAQLYIGAAGGGTNANEILYVRVWDRALENSEIEALAAL